MKRLFRLVWIVALCLMTGCYDHSDYSVQANSTVCDAEGDCMICTDGDCRVELSQSPVGDVCAGPGITNMLLGSCWTEQCIRNEKMLVPKIAGVNCVYVPHNAPNDEFVIGACDEAGVCGKP